MGSEVLGVPRSESLIEKEMRRPMRDRFGFTKLMWLRISTHTNTLLFSFFLSLETRNERGSHTSLKANTARLSADVSS